MLKVECYKVIFYYLLGTMAKQILKNVLSIVIVITLPVIVLLLLNLAKFNILVGVIT